MIVGIGVDVCSVERWESMIQRRPGVVARLLHPGEAARNPTSQAARFAAKEALAKALGAPLGLGWLDAEVTVAPSGEPAITVRGSVAARAAQLGVTSIHLSLSHDAGLAMAFVVCEGPGPDSPRRGG